MPARQALTPAARAQDDPDGVEYHEVWQRLPESVGEAWAFQLLGSGSGASPRRAFLAVAGDCFVFVADRRTPLAPAPGDDALGRNSRAAAAIAALPELSARREALSFEASYGRVAASPDGALPAWRIETSVLPGRAGQALLPADATRASLQAAADSGAALDIGAFSPPGGWRLHSEDADLDAEADAKAEAAAAPAVIVAPSTIKTVARGGYELEGRTVVVTGAAGGIGRGLAAAFAAQGAVVIVHDRDAAPLEAVRAALAAAHACATVHALACDLGSDDAVAAFAENCKGLLGPTGRIDALINNAGVEFPTPLSDGGGGLMASWSRLLDNNVTSMARLTRALLPLMSAGSSVVNQSSIWGLTAVADFSAYCASKHAVIGLTRSLAFELGAAAGIRVNAVCPGWIRTEAAMRSLTVMAAAKGVDEATMEKEILANQAIRTFLDPADIAALYLFLASNGAPRHACPVCTRDWLGADSARTDTRPADSAAITGQAIVASRGEVMH